MLIKTTCSSSSASALPSEEMSYYNNNNNDDDEGPLRGSHQKKIKKELRLRKKKKNFFFWFGHAIISCRHLHQHTLKAAKKNEHHTISKSLYFVFGLQKIYLTIAIAEVNW